jgi:selenocysteine lyase/cysteine desulfurase
MSIIKPIYLDNAATSHPKPECVYQAVIDRLRNGGSPGRGGYQQTMAADRLVFETREALAELFNAESSERFIFTANATIAINQALFGLLKTGDRIVTTKY